MTSLTSEKRILEGLCPPGAAVCVCTDDEVPAPMFPAEAEAMARAGEKRRQEFALGRTCAREALRQLGLTPSAIPVNSDRAPVWPRGIVGAITHTHGVIAAVVAPASELVTIGIDIEARARPLRTGLDARIRSPGERSRMAGFPVELDPVRLVFSAKEAVHKCLAPVSGLRLGFQEVELAFDISGNFRVMAVHRDDARLPDSSRLEGRFAVTNNFVMATAFIRPAG